MPKKIIMTEAMFNRTKNYIDQRRSRVLTSLQVMQERADEFINLIKQEYAQDFPTYCGRIEWSVNEIVKLVWDNVQNT